MGYTLDVGNLFKDAEEYGVISAEVLEVLRSKGIDHKIKARTGLSVIPIEADEVILVSVLIDDSQSIGFHDNAEAIIEGHNNVIESLKGSTSKSNILFRTQYLNGYVLNDWVLLKNAQKMSEENYRHDGMTPLYDASVVMLGSVLAEVQKAREKGKDARSGSLIVTDGKDEFSKECSAEDVSVLTQWMTRNNTEEYVEHAVAFMGIEGDKDISYEKVSKAMGIGLDSKKWLIRPGTDPMGIRRAFFTFSREMGFQIAKNNRWSTGVSRDVSGGNWQDSGDMQMPLPDQD